MRAKTLVSWVVAGGKRGEAAYCTRCGEGLVLGFLPRLTEWTAANRAFLRAHTKCKPGTYQEPSILTPTDWLSSRDTGVSSCTIFTAATDSPPPWGFFDVPYDPSDFGRCYRLLKHFPEFRQHLHKTVDLCPAWAPFVDHWDELTAIYEDELPSGGRPKLYALIISLGPAECRRATVTATGNPIARM
jgi:hypothetical protein